MRILFIVSIISNNKQNVIEGQLRCKQLAEYLDKLNVPKNVWLSEDGSGIISRTCYDSSTNQIVGLVLPINEKNGMPIPFTFTPNSVEDIENYLKKPKATLVYVIMAQPTRENVPPFVLQVFGTDNTFTTEEVAKRWEHTKMELKK